MPETGIDAGEKAGDKRLGLTSKDMVKKHYTEQGFEEWERLTKYPYNRLEFDTTMHFLRKHLPEKGLVLDAGGGPGRYAIELAKLGYDIILLDLTPSLLEIARDQVKEAKVEAGVKRIIEGSIDNLSMFEDNSFDAVICLGGRSLTFCTKSKGRRQQTNLYELPETTLRFSFQ